MASFAEIDVSQGSVATYARCGGIFNMHLTTNLPRNLAVIFFKSVKNWLKYGHESVALLFLLILFTFSSAMQVRLRSNEQGLRFIR